MLRIAILSLLADSDYSGYDLSKAFDASLTYLWAASQSQIYPELHRLEAKGLIEGVAVLQEGRPDKRMYHITDAGRTELLAWVAEPPTTWAIRDRFQLTTINIGRLEPEVARGHVLRQRELVQQRFDALTSIAEMLEGAGHAPGEPWNDQLGWRLTVEAGLRTAKAYTEWCDWALDQLDAATRPARTRATPAPLRG